MDGRQGIEARKNKVGLGIPAILSIGGKTIPGKIAEKGTKQMNDEWTSYKALKYYFEHSFASHGSGQYVEGECHMNTIEGFWSLLKRGMIGQYHYVTPRYLGWYI